jgi:hypothetical protein
MQCLSGLALSRSEGRFKPDAAAMGLNNVFGNIKAMDAYFYFLDIL